MTVQSIDIDIREDFLEDHWADEAKCESPHNYNTCSERVVARSICLICNPSGHLVCASAVAVITQILGLSPVPRCADCQEPVDFVWRVVPV